MGMIAVPSIVFSLIWPNWGRLIYNSDLSKSSTYYTIAVSIRCLSSGLIPSVILVTLNTMLYKKLMQMELQLKSSEFFSQNTKENMKKSMFRARLSFFIALIYVAGQILFWIPRLVCFLKPKYYRITYSSLQITAWRTDGRGQTVEFMVEQIAFLVCIIYCSIHYYVYIFALWMDQRGKNTKNEISECTQRTV